MLQPLRARRDYDEGPEASMIKPLAPSPGLVQKAIEDDAVEAEPSTPSMGAPTMKKFVLICPVCDSSAPFNSGAGATPEDSITCPKCANSTYLKDFVRSKEGSYVSKTASSMSVSFKRLWKMLPKGEEVTLSKGQVAEMHRILNSFKKFYDKVNKDL